MYRVITIIKRLLANNDDRKRIYCRDRLYPLYMVYKLSTMKRHTYTNICKYNIL